MTAAAPGPEAVVLSGGGAKGAYEVGVLSALAAGASPANGFRPIAPEIFSGTSVGSYNASFLAMPAANFGDAVARLKEIWQQRIAAASERCGNGVYRLRGLPFQGLNPGCFLHPLQAFEEMAEDGAFLARFAVDRGLGIATSRLPPLARLAEAFDLSAFFSTSPMRQLVEDTIDRRRLAAGWALRVVATNWQAGRAMVWTGDDIAHRVGTDAILASSAIPGIFKPQVVDGVPYVDGGVEATTPIWPALRAGARVLHVIYLDPTVSSLPLSPMSDTFEVVYRLYAILVSSHFDRLFATIQARRQQQAPGNPPLPILEGVPQLPTIHRYRPSNDLGGLAGMLEFRLSNIDRVMALGYTDTVRHDCAAAGCIVPEAVGEGPAAGARIRSDAVGSESAARRSDGAAQS